MTINLYWTRSYTHLPGHPEASRLAVTSCYGSVMVLDVSGSSDRDL